MATSTKKKTALSKEVSPKRIMEMTWSFASPLMIGAAIQNRVFDVLDGNPKTLEQVAKATSASERGLRALLNGLVGIGLLTRRGEKYGLASDTAAFLVSTKPSFVGGLLLHADQIIPKWLGLAEIVRKGKPATSVNQRGPGSKFFAKFVEDIFNMSYASASTAADTVLAGRSGTIGVLDIAAGSGVWGVALAHKSPTVRVTAVDWPGVIAVTRKVAAKHKVADRFSFVGGDILDADFGRNQQIATLGHILHSEGEERSRKMLKRVFASLASGGTIVIAEFTPDEDRRGPAIPLIFAVNMLVNTDDGDTFTFREIKSWLEEAGFRKVRSLETHGPSPLILADKP